jgi:hypothetical protein
VAGLTILVRDLDQAAAPYAALLGTLGEEATSAIAGARLARRFTFGSQWIDLVETDPDAIDLQTHIAERGAAPYEIVLAGASGVDPLPRDPTHGARIRFAD